MKAWILSDRTGNNPYLSLVWAETVGKAKSLANSPDGSMHHSNVYKSVVHARRFC